MYLLPLAASCYIVDKYVKLTEHFHNIQSQQPQTLASAPLPVWYLDAICPLLPLIQLQDIHSIPAPTRNCSGTSFQQPISRSSAVPTPADLWPGAFNLAFPPIGPETAGSYLTDCERADHVVAVAVAAGQPGPTGLYCSPFACIFSSLDIL